MAFYDPEAPGEVAARAYLITAEQFVDVLAQETLRSPGMALDLTPTFRGDRYSNGVGGYSILVRVGCRRITWRRWQLACARPTGGHSRRSIAICRRSRAQRPASPTADESYRNRAS